MNRKEKDLFFELCKYQQYNTAKLERLIDGGAATPAVLGQLFHNRMAGMAYCVLKDSRLTGRTGREFRNSLKNAYQQNIEINNAFFDCLSFLTDILSGLKGKYALLKGAYLCGMYPAGCRTSNDIDILVDGADVTLIAEQLSRYGFRQGSIQNEHFIPASRKEIIASKMMRGETVPFIKQVDLPFMKFLEIDINFSLNFKNEEKSAVPELISRACETGIADFKIMTLQAQDFVIHLCNHLYKEVSVYPWVRMNRDMTLYKFCDLYMLCRKYSESDFAALEQRVREVGVEQICYCALCMTKKLFAIRNKWLDHFLEQIAPADKAVLDIVIYPEEKKAYRYNEPDIRKRFFARDRISLLKEVKPNDYIRNAWK